MPVRALPSLPDTCLQQNCRIHPDTPDTGPPDSGVDLNHTWTTPSRTLSPVSDAKMNLMNGTHHLPNSPNAQQAPPKSSTGTIRAAPPEPLYFSSLSPYEYGRIAQGRVDSAATLHTNRPLPTASTTSSFPPLTRQNSGPYSSGIVRQISSEFGPTKSYSNSNLHIPDDQVLSPDGSNSSISPGPGSAGTWSSAIGKANLGKSGRVIERLMGENDMLKRDLKIERLRAEDAQQAVKIVEARLETLHADYDSRLHDTTINKTLLKRRERQVAELKAQVEVERVRAEAALDRERGWRETMERDAEDCKKLVEDAQTYAALMDGRNNAMTSHWRDQGAEVDRATQKLRTDVEYISQQRKLDDARMTRLQSLCNQQIEELAALRKEKEVIAAKHELYKAEQDECLRDIKQKARQQEQQNEQTIFGAQKLLGELKWALGIKESLREHKEGTPAIPAT